MITALDKNTALVLIDLQKSIASRQTATPANTIIENAAKLVAAFHKASLPVVAVNVNPADAAWTKTRKQSGPPQSMVFDEEALRIVPELKTQPGDIFITKHTWNAFFETALHNELKKRNVTGIVLAGISTSIGVEGTARAASEHGYNLAFATDAMTDMLAEAHEHSLKNIFPRIGETGTTAEIIEKLS